jgi:hypothetical protein
MWLLRSSARDAPRSSEGHSRTLGRPNGVAGQQQHHDEHDQAGGGTEAEMACSARVVVQAQLVETERGLVPEGDGWFILNALEAQWWKRRVTVCDFEGEPRFRQLGINLTLLEPGEPMTMYHWEADQEDFLMLAGEALLVIEGEERTLRQCDFVHCPALA